MYFWELLANGSSLELAIWGMYFGVVLACLLALYEKRVIGKFVRTLLQKGALSPETAMTLADLGYEKNPFIKRSLRGKTALSTLVYIPGEEHGLPEDPASDEELHPIPAIRGKLDFTGTNTKFYIPAPLRHRAAIRFEQHGTHLMSVVVAIILFAAVAILLVWGLPKAIDFVRDLFSTLLASA